MNEPNQWLLSCTYLYQQLPSTTLPPSPHLLVTNLEPTAHPHATAEDEEKFRRNRELELKHGRICMVATIGRLVVGRC